MGIKITHFRCGHKDIQDGFQPGPNSAGGVDVTGLLTNTGDKTIKYITLRFIPYNAVNDAVFCDIKGVSQYGLQCTGPIAPNQFYAFYGANMWYNHSITRVEISKAEIEYMDGSTETIPGSQIPVEAAPTSGCYVATAVYGSYDCPQVWTLRRYRDCTLAETWYGRAFIHTYYAISPSLVRLFGDKKWFKQLWKGKLDRMVKKLNDKGVADTPYQDKAWR